ncbi:unnamed protein product, partial [Tuber aestivum]
SWFESCRPGLFSLKQPIYRYLPWEFAFNGPSCSETASQEKTMSCFPIVGSLNRKVER